jgi:hypothetical protein
MIDKKMKMNSAQLNEQNEIRLRVRKKAKKQKAVLLLLTENRFRQTGRAI